MFLEIYALGFKSFFLNDNFYEEVVIPSNPTYEEAIKAVIAKEKHFSLLKSHSLNKQSVNDWHLSSNAQLIQKKCLELLNSSPIGAIKTFIITNANANFHVEIIPSYNNKVSTLNETLANEWTNFAIEKMEDIREQMQNLCIKDKSLIEPYIEPKLSKWKIVVTVATLGIFILAIAIYNLVQTCLFIRDENRIKYLTALIDSSTDDNYKFTLQQEIEEIEDADYKDRWFVLKKMMSKQQKCYALLTKNQI